MSRQQSYPYPGYDNGTSATLEYFLLFGVSVLIFTALCIGMYSYMNMAASSSESANCALIAGMVTKAIADTACDDRCNEISMSLELPGTINGNTYIAYPSADGKALLIRVNDESSDLEYSYPVCIKNDSIRLEGWIISSPGEHFIRYEPGKKTLTLS